MRPFPIAVLVALLTGAAAVATPQDGSNHLPETFTAFAVNLGGLAPPQEQRRSTSP